MFKKLYKTTKYFEHVQDFYILLTEIFSVHLHKQYIMKVKHIVAIFLLAYILEVLGVHFKIMHLTGAPQLFNASTTLKIIAALLGIWKLFTIKDFSNFLNK